MSGIGERRRSWSGAGRVMTAMALAATLASPGRAGASTGRTRKHHGATSSEAAPKESPAASKEPAPTAATTETPAAASAAAAPVAAAGVTPATPPAAAAPAPTPPSPVPAPANSPEPAAAGAEVQEGGGLFEQSQSAAPTKDPSGPPSAAPMPFTLNGYVRGDAFAGKVPNARAGELKANYGELGLQVRTPKESWGDGFAEARVRYGLQDHVQSTTVDLREAYVNTYLGPFDLRLGQQIIVWGRADALNPTSNLTPVDLRVHSPIEDDRRVGNVGARAFLRFAPFRLEGVWMPMYLPTTLPTIGLPQYVSFGDPIYPSNDLRNGLGAGRLHLELAKFEMSVSYLRGYAPLPGLTLTGLTFDPNTPSVLVSRTAYQHQVFGFDFSTALGDVMGLRGEAAYRKPLLAFQDNVNVARPDLQYVLGVDHNFGSLSVILQYMGRYVFDWQKETGPETPLMPSDLKQNPMDVAGPVENAAKESINLTLRQINQVLFNQTAKLQHLATVRLEYLTLHDTLSLSVLALGNFTTREWAVAPKIGWHISDTLMAYLGAEIFHGPANTLFGLIDAELSAGYVELRYTF